MFSRQISSQRRRFFSGSSNSGSSSDYCFNLVKNHDFENYLIGLLVPKRDRRHFYAIHAFNVEMALIKSSTADNKNAARLRCKWWLDFLSQVYDGGLNQGSYQHPVSQSLVETIQERSLSRRWLEYIVESRLQEILSPQVETLSDLEDLVEKSHSSLLYLTLEAVNPKQSYPQEIDYMASHVGVSFGLVTILRGTAFDLSQVNTSLCPSHSFPSVLQGQLKYPNETMLTKGLPPTFAKTLARSMFDSQRGQGEPLSADEQARFREVVFDTAAQAYGHLDRARSSVSLSTADLLSAVDPSKRSSLLLLAPPVSTPCCLPSWRRNI
jgi:hypothetical protein